MPLSNDSTPQYNPAKNESLSISSKLLSLETCAMTVARCKGRIGLCTGCFDILQPGHAVFFEQCKAHCDCLVVVVGKSRNISKIKPGRPINPDFNRLFLVAAMQPVDYAILGDDEYYGKKIDCVGVCNRIKPNVLIVNDDDNGLAEKQDFCGQRGIRMVTLSRTVPDFLTPTSTTEIIKLKMQAHQEHGE